MWFTKTHLWGIFYGRLLAYLYAHSSQSSFATIGGISFYGNKAFLEECLKAINEELPKYDTKLHKLFLSGDIKLKIINYERCSRKSTTAYEKSPTSGTYSIPEIFWRDGACGICLFVVYAYYLTDCTGTGLISAIYRDLNKTKATKQAKYRVIAWMQEKSYPRRWFAYF